MRDAGLALGEFLAPGVRISTRHYTLVADDTAGPRATAAGFVAATRQVQGRVRHATGVWLTPEPDALGDLPAYQQLLDRANAAGGEDGAPVSAARPGRDRSGGSGIRPRNR
jgi:UDP-N-acetylmuramate dehydrogenase